MRISAKPHRTVLGRVIAGLTGASMSTASAYIADISMDEDRTKKFGMIRAALGLGFIMGSVIGGLLGLFGTGILSHPCHPSLPHP
ncbi:MFS transporter [Sphingobacterium sp. HMA12]|uniref:MFS transporter n=1 Tax=Sphingobacterium sp. HMA12 TaxID=2050894 RepID=UPI001F2F1E33|nr:MFS transporter [Sphingobacterium sp. HMA12]